MVFVDVRTILFFTFERHPRSGDFTQSVDVVSFQAQAFLNLLTHLLSPRFCTKSTNTKSEFFFFDTHLFHLFGHIKRIRRCTSHTRNMQVANQTKMFFGITSRSRNHSGTKVFYTVMSTQSAGKQAIAVADRERIITRHTESCQTSRHGFRPDSKVFTRIPHNGRITRST